MSLALEVTKYAKAAYDSTLEPVRSQDENWPDLEHAAVVKVTSEERDFPVEAALV